MEVPRDLRQAEAIPVKKPDDLRVQWGEASERVVQFVVLARTRLFSDNRLVAEAVG